MISQTVRHFKKFTFAKSVIRERQTQRDKYYHGNAEIQCLSPIIRVNSRQFFQVKELQGDRNDGGGVKRRID